MPKTCFLDKPVVSCKIVEIASHGFEILIKTPLKPDSLIFAPTSLAFLALISNSPNLSPVLTVAAISPKEVTIISTSVSYTHLASVNKLTI